MSWNCARRAAGFTLVEILVALAVLAIALTATARSLAEPSTLPQRCATAPSRAGWPRTGWRNSSCAGNGRIST